MGQKNYTEVLIDGRIYTLGGMEDELYLQKVAAYLNEKGGRLKKQEGFSRLSADYQALMIELNIADDYFKEQERADRLAEQKAALEKEAYSLKHELITTQMKLEKLEAAREAAAEAAAATSAQADLATSAQADFVKPEQADLAGAGTVPAEQAAEKPAANRPNTGKRRT